MAHGDETVVIVAIDQPLCAHRYGDGLGSPTPLGGSPLAAFGCRAVLGVDGVRKCHNTRFTCQDEENYSPGTLTLLFAKPQRGLWQYGYVIPSLMEIVPSAGAINLAGMDRNASALGQREQVNLTFINHLHSDLYVDKYRLERISGSAGTGSPSERFDPYTRGTFWGKWLARNPYYSSYALRVYRGVMGQALAAMEVRHYIIESIDGPNYGKVTLVAKDKFSRIEARKAVAPTASRGELSAGISAVASSFSVTPAGIGVDDYPFLPGSPSEMYVAIGDEIIKCTRSADTFTVIQRGALGTTADTHNQEDLVQWVLVYRTQLPHDLIYDLLTEYGGIDAADIDQADWDEQADEVTVLYTAYIAEPTPVNKLVGEICEQAGLTVWPDVPTGAIRLRALRTRAAVETVDDDAWMVSKTLTTKHLTDRRVSQVWVYYGKKNPMEGHEDIRNYYSRLVEIDPTAEESTQYDEAKIHTIFSRWIPQFGRSSASETGNRILTIFRDSPLEAKFQLDREREGALEVTDYITLDSASVESDLGQAEPTLMAVTAMKRSAGRIEVTALEVSFETITGEAETGERVIQIENDAFNINLESIHDSLYSEPPAGSPPLTVRFIVLADVTVGSTTTATAAVVTGSWTARNVNLVLENRGRIQGKGGAGANGTNVVNGDGLAGSVGGDALQAQHAIVVDNSSGQIWSGGGGGGSSAPEGAGSGGLPVYGSCSGGGAAGTNAGAAGTAGSGSVNGNNGSAGTSETGGAGGPATVLSGKGGNGGAPGVAGAAADAGFAEGAPGPGGAAGRYIVGNSFVSWTSPTGDVRGNVA